MDANREKLLLTNNKTVAAQQLIPKYIGVEPADVLVIGGGISGMRAALDLADAGLKVYLIEQTPCLGGRVAQLGYMFPQHDCVLCRGTPDHGYGCTRPSISPAYIQHNQHPNLEILTNTKLLAVEGQAGDFTASLRQEPRYVDIQRCINCGKCVQVCPQELPDIYQSSMVTHKAIYKVAARAIPDTYLIAKGTYCNSCGKCIEVCPTCAINLDEQPQLMTLAIGAIILALGFQIFDPTEIPELGYQRFPNVIQAMQYERLASRSGPTEGIVTRPSDGRRPRSIAWLQCVGSRDKANPYCSSICCMYATKEAILAKQRLGSQIDCSIFIMDERAFNKEYSAYFTKARQTHGIHYYRSRVSSIQEDPTSHDILVNFADSCGNTFQERYDMVVLATGVKPPDTAGELAEILDIELNQYGFCLTDKFAPLQTGRPGVFVCGAFSSPKEIVETIIDASGAAAEVMRLLNDRLRTHSYSRALPFLSSSELPPETIVEGEPTRVGVFVCSCGKTIEESLDLRKLIDTVNHWQHVEAAIALDFACFPESLAVLQEWITQRKISRIVIAACSNRTHEPLFQRAVSQAGLNPYCIEVVNIREQCARVHKQQKELANRKAVELIRLAVGRLLYNTPVYKEKHTCEPVALVIGAGVAGMTSALAIADSGYDVHLVERSEILGGNLRNLYYVAEGYNPQRLLRDLVNRVRAHRRIIIHTRTEIVDHSGHVGHFISHLHTTRSDGEVEELSLLHGVIIVATGAQETHQHPILDFPQAITQRDLEEKIIHSPEEIAALKDVVMLQCVTPIGTPNYCSRVCCTNTIKNAIRIKLFNPSCNVTVLYKNIVTYGFREEYYTKARQLGVIFTRYSDDLPPEIEPDGKQLLVKSHEPSLNRWLGLPADLLIVSMAITPAEGTSDLSRILRIPLSSEGFFQEAQMKLRPMDFMRDGIFLAGMAHYPKFLEESISHALAASARALTLLSQQSLYLGGVVAQVDATKCVGCLTCTRVCPFSIPRVIQRDEVTGVGKIGNAAYIEPALCQGCGTCTGECPATAIQLVNYTDEQMMLRNIKGLGKWSSDLFPSTVDASLQVV